MGSALETFGRMPSPGILVVVVDNDSARSAADICDAVSLPWPAKYAVELPGELRRPEIQRDSPENFDFLVRYRCDDEVPAPRWLDELLWTQSCFEADVVCGPVLPRFDAGTPDWLKTGRFFSRHTYTTGDTVENCGAGNVLISWTVKDGSERMDERFV